MAQIATRIITWKSVFANPEFRRGWNEAVAGKPFDYKLDSNWMYERGRLMAIATQYRGPLFAAGNIHPTLVPMIKQAVDEKVWI